MRLAVPFEHGHFTEFFERTDYIKMYDVDMDDAGRNVIRREGVLAAPPKDPSGKIPPQAMADFLVHSDVQMLLCCEMEMPMQQAIANQRIRILIGAEGNADEIVLALIEGRIGVQHHGCGGCGGHGGGCGHHGEGHGHGEGGCCGHHGEGRGEGHGHGEGGCCGHHGEGHGEGPDHGERECGHHGEGRGRGCGHH